MCGVVVVVVAKNMGWWSVTPWAPLETRRSSALDLTLPNDG